MGRTVEGMYEIVVSGRLPTGWDQWFDGFVAEVIASRDGPVTHLRGPIADQAALHGTLARIRDLALPVISVQRMATPAEQPRSATPGP